MSLREKIVLILFSVMMLYVCSNYLIQKLVIYPNFVELERVEARKDITRCVEAIHREIFHLDSLCHDWAAWDDTYEFIDNRNEDYMENNLIVDTFIVQLFLILMQFPVHRLHIGFPIKCAISSKYILL